MAGLSEALAGSSDLELSLVYFRDDPGQDPVLGLRSIGSSRWIVRSEPLPGECFLRLREVWEARRGEGFRLESVIDGVRRSVDVARFALDFEGHWARARAHEQAGRVPEALEAYRRSSAPGASDEVARLSQAPARGGEAPPSSEAPARAEASPGSQTPASAEALDDEAAILAILRAIAADGKVDAQEMKTYQALSKVFPVPAARTRELVQQVRDEPRDPDGTPMDPRAVLGALVRRARVVGRIGPESTQALRRAAAALGLDRAAVLEVVKQAQA